MAPDVIRMCFDSGPMFDIFRSFVLSCLGRPGLTFIICFIPGQGPGFPNGLQISTYHHFSALLSGNVSTQT